MRGGNHALLLPDGRVLAVSFNNGSPVAELFDPSTESWSLTNAPSGAAGGGELVLLPSGLVLGAGRNSSQLYDPATGMWGRTSNLKAIDEWVYTLTVLRNGLVLATGSHNSWRETRAELYDPATGTWQLTGSPAENFSCCRYTATLMPNGHVLVAGGGFYGTRSIELYDPTTGVWSPMPSLVDPRDYHTATLLANDKVLFAAGFEGDWYWFPTFHTSTELFDLDLPPDSSLVGDFNADGKSDILSRNGKRDLAAWQMNGMVISSNSLLPTASAGWSTSAVGDFDGDSKDDILWRSVSGDVGV